LNVTTTLPTLYGIIRYYYFPTPSIGCSTDLGV
jgi:hypothetical protein